MIKPEEVTHWIAVLLAAGLVVIFLVWLTETVLY